MSYLLITFGFRLISYDLLDNHHPIFSVTIKNKLIVEVSITLNDCSLNNLRRNHKTHH